MLVKFGFGYVPSEAMTYEDYAQRYPATIASEAELEQARAESRILPLYKNGKLNLPGSIEQPQ